MKKIFLRNGILVLGTIFALSPGFASAELSARTLKFGDISPDVRELQIALNSTGGNVTKKGEETDRFGEKTLQAVKSIQCEHSIACSGDPSHGIFGPRTRTLLISLQRRPNPHVLGASTDSLTAHYSFDGNADDSDGSNNGTLIGGPAYATGKIGQALQFDGADDGVNMGNDFVGTGPMTFSAWVNPRSHGESGGGRIFGNGKTTMLLSATNRFYFTSNGSTVASVLNNSIPFSTWTFVAATRDASGLVNLYVNGVRSGAANQNAGIPAAATTNLIIGNNLAGDRAFDGSIDDVRLYSRALSPSEISEIFASGGGVVAPPTAPPMAPVDTGTPPPIVPPVILPPASVRTPAPAPVAWTAPIGIPTPSFGIAESHFMYQLPVGATCTDAAAKGCFNFTDGRGVSAYPDAGAGPYTHYVDNSLPACTIGQTTGCSIDAGNAFGTPSKPRKTIPTNLPAGSVVEVHGGPYIDSAGLVNKRANGEVNRPVFIRGAYQANKPVISFQLRPDGQYLILENLLFKDRGALAFHQTNINAYVAVRNSEFTNSTPYNPIWVDGPSGNIVIYNNNVHDNGDWQSLTEVGHHIQISGAGGETNRVWVVDNHIHHNGEDGIQTFRGNPKHLYIGRNEMDHNRENAIDLKVGEDVIISQNIMHGYRRTSSSGGDAIRLNDEGILKNIWVVYNDIFDSTYGIDTWATTFPAYIIGNKIHDLVGSTRGGTYYKSIGITGGSAGPIVNNLIYNVDVGLYEYNTDIINNIVFNARIQHMDACHTSHGCSDLSNNVLWQSDGVVRIDAPCVNCVQADPKFQDSMNGDFRLRSESPAIDAGSATLANDSASAFFTSFGLDIRKDFLGTARPQGAGWDIGPYEFYAGQPIANPNPLTPIVVGPVTPLVPLTSVDTDMDGVFDANDLCPNTPLALKLKVNTRGCIKPKMNGFDILPNLEQDLRAVANLVIGKSDLGKIAYSQPIALARDEEELDIEKNLIFAPKKVILHSVNLRELNLPATITMFNVNMVNPKILKDGIECMAPACAITAFDTQSKTITFIVSGFSTYEVVEGSAAPIIMLGASVPIVPNPTISAAVIQSQANGSGNAESSRGWSSGAMANIGSGTCAPGQAFNTSTGQRCASAAYAFARNLAVGARGEDVRQLQIFLNASEFAVASSGAGSPGSETLVFGPATRSALARYQASKGIAPAAGYFGPATRARVNGGGPNIFLPSPAPAPSQSTGTTLRLGSFGPAVKLLRQKLRDLGYFAAYGSASGAPSSAVEETSIFGATTESAVRKFQCDKSIVCAGAAATTGWGAAGPRTRARLGM